MHELRPDTLKFARWSTCCAVTALAEARHFWFRGLRAFVTPLIRRATAGRSNPTILDCGCGTGANLRAARSLRPRVRLRSLAGRLVDSARSRHDDAWREPARRPVPFPSGAFDLVTSFDVLYSLEDEDERAAMAEMHRVLKPGGYAIINVAAMDALRGDHSVLSHEVRRYSRHCSTNGSRAPDSIDRLTYTNFAIAAAPDRPRPATAARAASRSSRASGNHRSGRAGQRRADRAVLAESV